MSKNLWTALKNGFIGRCPNCGKGKLFQSYLKQVDHCASCGEKFGHIRADDGPAWLTLILTGHIMAPFLLIFLPRTDWPEWLTMLFWSAIAFILTMVLLPRSKGLFIAIIWHMKLQKNN